MDETFVQALHAAKNPEDKAALIAEASIGTLSNEEALIARQCVLFHWFDQSIVEGLLQALPSHTVNMQDVYKRITLLSFIEKTPWGMRYQDLTRQGLLKFYTQTQPELLKDAARLAAPLYRVSTENDRNAIEALFCSIISGDTTGALYLNTLLEQAMSYQDWSKMESLFHLQEEAEHLPFVEPLPRTEQYWMLRSIVDRVGEKFDEARSDYSHVLALNPENALAYLNRSILSVQQQHYEQANADYREALQLDPSLVQTYIASGILAPPGARIPQLGISVFYIYVSEDEDLCRALEKHLSVLRHEGKIVEWSKRKILPGADNARTIDQTLLSSSFIFLLISPDFLASDYCYGQDIQRALEQHKSGSAHVIPILLRPADWEDAPFAHLQYLPRNARPITLWAHPDEAFQVIASEIRLMLEETLSTSAISASHASSPRTNHQPATASTNTRHFLHKYDAHADTPLTVAWSPDGTRIASGGLDNTVHIWQATTGRHLLTYHHLSKIPPYGVYIARWSPDSKYIASAGGSSSKVSVWNALDGHNIVLYHGHSPVLSSIFSLAWSPDGRFIASSSMGFLEALAHIWDASSGKNILKINAPKLLRVQYSGCVAWSPDGLRVVAKEDKRLYVCHAQTGKVLLTFNKHNEFIVDVAWSQDNQWIVSAQTQKVIVWNPITGMLLLSYERHLGPLREIALSPDGKYVASASEDRTVHVWELLTGKQRLMYTGHSDRVISVTWSSDSTRIASASADKSVHVWRTLLDE